jgi:hypothetical protein
MIKWRGLEDALQVLVSAKLHHGPHELLLPPAAKGLARGAGRGIEDRIAACRPVVVCVNDRLNEPRKEVISFMWSRRSLTLLWLI